VIEEFRGEALTTFDGLPVFAFGFGEADGLVPGDTPPDVEAWAWRVGATGYDDPGGSDIFRLFLDVVDTSRVRALLLGAWHGDVAGEGSDEFQRALLDAADRFPGLEALFLADVSEEMSQISWVEQHDPADLLAAFPRLRVLGMRGASELAIEPFVHDRIEELALQSGGLPPEVVRALGHSSLPQLSSLDLYLGVDAYGGGATAADLEPILHGNVFPRLRHLALRDAENADDLAAVLAHAPVVAGLESLDLSLGTLGDEGAAALLAGQPLTHLKRLDLHHHFLSDAMVHRLREALPEVDIDVSEQMKPRVWNTRFPERDDFGRGFRYVAVDE
jgi:hypothetical protein